MRCQEIYYISNEIFATSPNRKSDLSELVSRQALLLRAIASGQFLTKPIFVRNSNGLDCKTLYWIIQHENNVKLVFQEVESFLMQIYALLRRL